MQKFKFGCFEALSAEDEHGVHVKCLVTDRDGAYVGVIVRDLGPDPKARQNIDHIRRFKPRRIVKRISAELMRAADRKMLHMHLPKGAKDENAKRWVLAHNVMEAREHFDLGAPKQPYPPATDAAPPKRKKARKSKKTNPAATPEKKES